VVSEETDASRFLTGLQEVVGSCPALIQGQAVTASLGGFNNVVGKWTEQGLFIVPNLALKKITDLGVFEQLPNELSMGRALLEKGALVTQEGKIRYQLRFNGIKARGWMIKDEFVNRIRELPQAVPPSPLPEK